MSDGSVSVHLERRESPVVCLFCRDALPGEAPACPRCDARWHPECRAEAARCPTLGCDGRGSERPDVRRRRLAGMVLRWWPLYVSLLLIPICWVGLLVLVSAAATQPFQLADWLFGAFYSLALIVVGLSAPVYLVRGLVRIVRRWRIQRAGNLVAARVERWSRPPDAPFNALVFSYRALEGGPELVGETRAYPRGELVLYPPGTTIWVWADPSPPHAAWWENDDD